MGMVAGVITVLADGTYTASPSLGPFGNPATATSLAQALFEKRYPPVLAGITAADLAVVIDRTTSPVTIVKSKVLGNIAAQANADAAAIVGYMQAAAKAHVTTQQLGVTTTTGVAINAPGSPVDIPIN